MFGSTCLEAMVKFATRMLKVFGKEYLREPNVGDTTRLLAVGESRGFTCMIGNFDCMH